MFAGEGKERKKVKGAGKEKKKEREKRGKEILSLKLKYCIIAQDLV